MENLIKTIEPINCPNCKKIIVVEFLSRPTVIGSVYRQEDILTAKGDVLLKIQDLHIPEEKKDDITMWVNNPETVFGPSEVQAIIDNAKKDQE